MWAAKRHIGVFALLIMRPEQKETITESGRELSSDRLTQTFYDFPVGTDQTFWLHYLDYFKHCLLTATL